MHFSNRIAVIPELHLCKIFNLLFTDPLYFFFCEANVSGKFTGFKNGILSKSEIAD